MKMKLEKIDWDRFNDTNLFGNFHRFDSNLEAELIKTFRDIIYGDEMFNKSVWKFIFHPQQEEERERNIYIPQINNALKCYYFIDSDNKEHLGVYILRKFKVNLESIFSGNVVEFKMGRRSVIAVLRSNICEIGLMTPQDISNTDPSVIVDKVKTLVIQLKNMMIRMINDFERKASVIDIDAYVKEIANNNRYKGHSIVKDLNKSKCNYENWGLKDGKPVLLDYDYTRK